MNIVLVSSEVFPFCKTGGLADAVGAMAQAFSRIKGSKVAVFVPLYRSIGGGAFSLKAASGVFRVPVADRLETVSLLKTEWGAVTVYFVDCPKYFDRSELYRTKSGDFQDNDERFICFSRAVLEGLKFIDFKPDIIHCHDWQAGLIPAYVKTLYAIDAFFAHTGTLFTVHNMAYQGCFSREALFKAGFGWVDFTPDKLEYYGGINFLKAGLVYADYITTVSPTYALEIQSAHAGRGLEGVVAANKSRLEGILNGIDTEVWDPESDSYLPRGYDASGWQKGKTAAKQHLQEVCGLTQGEKTLLAGVVSRLEHQKGSDLIVKAVGQLAEKMQFVILGVGDPAMQEHFAELAKAFPSRVHYRPAFDEALAHKIYAAADLFVMPSRFEPCGLGQMIAMRYGSVPLAVKTGGLADTVFGYPAAEANGFTVNTASETELLKAFDKALEAYQDKAAWGKLVAAGMSADYSWGKSAERYLELFGKIIQKLR